MAEPVDVVVIGAGIVGCSVAYALARDGARVTVLERGEIGREASWAAGGILTPIRPHTYPPGLLPLCEKGMETYEVWIPSLIEESGIDPEYEEVGLLLLIQDEEDEREADTVRVWKREKGHPVESLDLKELRERVPTIHQDFKAALFLPNVYQVRNPRLLRALAGAAERRSVVFRTHTTVRGILRDGDRVVGVRADHEEIRAKTVVIAAGCWSAEPDWGFSDSLPVKPIRGQMVLTEETPLTFRHVLLWKERYLIPRRDGKILIGSTMEDVGFQSRVTAGGVSSLLETAARIIPSLKDRPFLRAWAGLRPGTPDRLPYLGPIPGADGAIAATGHYRNGILIGPLTGEIIASIVGERPSPVPLDPYRPGR